MLKCELEARVKMLEESLAECRKDFSEAEEQRNDALDKCELLTEHRDNLRRQSRDVIKQRDSLTVTNDKLVKRCDELVKQRDLAQSATTVLEHERDCAIEQRDGLLRQAGEAVVLRPDLTEKLRIMQYMLTTLGHSHKEARDAVDFIKKFLGDEL